MGDAAAVVQFGTEIDLAVHRTIRAFAASLAEDPLPGMIEFVPAFTTLTVFFDPIRTTFADLERILAARWAQMPEASSEPGRTVEIPVCYGGEFGPDIGEVASHNGISVDEVIQIHTAGEYVVYMIGFAPGFPYLGGMSERIAAPRRANPRLAIPAGTVGIAGMQTGVYPIETPGGWQLIGRTPVRLFRPEENPPSLLQAGDVVRFYPVSREAYARLLEEERVR
ncbi:MAG: 5-oxoprolinase subunit PxpB [Alicyclobacillus sp.]|nr:5-oxoprolinase subunit PxpB [Alicyclobacillus sp.]